MIKNCIVGSGFSAAVSYLLLNKKSNVFAVISEKKLEYTNLKKRKNLVSNKILSKKISSFGSIDYNIKKAIFHDRNCLGGNTNIWGGHINIRKISKKLIMFLNKKGFYFKNLSYNTTGTDSNLKSIRQIQDANQNIFKSQSVFDKIDNFYLSSFKVKQRKIILKLICLKSLKTKNVKVNNLFLCIGSIQLIDLLKRSGFIKNGDIISFTEFDHEFKFKLNNKFRINKKNTLIKYNFGRALGHFLGIQSYKKILRLVNFVPVYIYQIFYNKKKEYKLILKDYSLNEVYLKNSKKFGDSIHYCNMKINNVSINNYLKKINKNIFGFGMSFVSQSKPGPISNDIIIDICQKLKRKGKLKKFNSQ